MKFNYKVAFDRITKAYIKEELNPWRDCGCFIGNLLNNQNEWSYGRNSSGVVDTNYIEVAKMCVKQNSEGFYEYIDIVELERHFLFTLQRECGIKNPKKVFNNSLKKVYLEELPIYEEALFKAMSSTLDMLKEIHIKKGENIEETFDFKQRKLQIV